MLRNGNECDKWPTTTSSGPLVTTIAITLGHFTHKDAFQNGDTRDKWPTSGARGSKAPPVHGTGPTEEENAVVRSAPPKRKQKAIVSNDAQTRRTTAHNEEQVSGSQDDPGMDLEDPEKDGEWLTNSKKSRWRSQADQSEMRQQRQKQALQIAQAELMKMAGHRRRTTSTLCVFLGINGAVMARGESGGPRSGGEQTLTTVLVKNKSQATGYGGRQCAEPDAVLQLKGNMQEVRYTLAYDQKSKQYKAACKSCHDVYVTPYKLIDLAK